MDDGLTNLYGFIVLENIRDLSYPVLPFVVLHISSSGRQDVPEVCSHSSPFPKEPYSLNPNKTTYDNELKRNLSPNDSLELHEVGLCEKTS
jgi:hypothetical protein